MKIAIITGSRADWNGLSMVAHELRGLRGGTDIDVKVIAIGQHAENADHLQTVIADGFDPKVIRTDRREDMATSCGIASIALAGALDEFQPDMALVLGDRFEILGAASAVALRGIPLAHIGGGDVTEGSIDNKIRYAITALADLHFVTNQKSFTSAWYMRDEDTKTMWNTGNPALDRITATKIETRTDTFDQLGLLRGEHNIVVAYHAVTTDDDGGLSGCFNLLAALDQLENCSVLLLGTNADTGSGAITESFRQFSHNNVGKAAIHSNLSPQLFYSVLAHFDCMVGNSSAGLVETASFGIPVVNIGERQTGRPQPLNARTCKDDTDSILHTIKLQLTEGRKVCTNPYGDGHSAPRIANIIVKYLGRST